MKGESKPILEKLYLHKGEDGDIFVPTYCEKDSTKHLTQYQIDGLRFLYKQYKRNKPGVILNHPSGYGKTVQVVLFLLAIKHLRQKYVLILCNEKDVNNWKEHFHQWADCDDIIDGPYPTTREGVYINSVMNAPKLAKRWDVVIVEYDKVYKSALRMNARYKIWLTSLDIKANLPMFLWIYHWFYQKDYLEIGDSTPMTNMKDIIEKAIRLDALLEDTVIGHNAKKNNSSLFRQIEEVKPIIVPTLKTYVSKKNKDATGAKVKRSKKALLNKNISTASVNSEPVEPDPNINVDTNINKIHNNDFNINNEEIKWNNHVEVECDESQNNDVESFIRNQKPITSEGFEDYIDNVDSSSQNSKESKTEIYELYIYDDEQNIRVQKSLNSPVLVVSIENDDNSIDSSKIVDIQKDVDNNEYNYRDLKSLNDINGDTIVKQITNVEINVDELNDHKKESEIGKIIVNIDNKSDVYNNKRKNNDKPVVNTHNDTDAKFAEIEEIAVKKFKGSLLDRIFNK